MKTKTITMFLLLFFISKNSIANNFQEGDTLYVWAVNGLKLRKGPSLDFPIIKKLNYGEKVKVIDGLNDTYRMSIKVIDREGSKNDFEIKGNWIKIKLVDDTEGYIYDGYLSRLPVMRLDRNREYNKESEEYWKAETFGNYAKREFGGIQRMKDEIGNPRKGVVVYGDDIKVILTGEVCYDVEIEIPQLSFNEAYLLFNLMYQVEKQIQFQNSLKENGWMEIKIVKEDNQYQSFSLGIEGGVVYSISFRDGKIVINETHCC